jgi:hypothetical protein
MTLRRGNIVLGKYGLRWTFSNAERAIDALIRVDNEKIGALVKAIDRTNINAISVFAFDTGLGNDISHEKPPSGIFCILL